MHFDIEYKLNMESLDCSYIVCDAILRTRESQEVCNSNWVAGVSSRCCLGNVNRPTNEVWAPPVSSKPQRVCDIGRDTCLSDQMTILTCNKAHTKTHVWKHTFKTRLFYFLQSKLIWCADFEQQYSIFSALSQINTYGNRAVRRLPKLIAPLCGRLWPPWLA